MKHIRNALFFFLILLLSNACNIHVFAATEPFGVKINKIEIDTFVRNIELQALDYEPQTKHISGFAVDEEGRVAVVYKADRTVVSVYSPDGVFEFGYQFIDLGTTLLSFEDEVLNIYFVRSDCILSINKEGEIQNLTNVDNTDEFQKELNELAKTNKKVTLGDKTYYLNNDMKILNLSGKYSTLLVSDTNGKEVVLIKSTEINPFSIFLICFCSVLIVVSVVSTIHFINKKRFG